MKSLESCLNQVHHFVTAPAPWTECLYKYGKHTHFTSQPLAFTIQRPLQHIVRGRIQKQSPPGTAPVVQRLRPHASNAGSLCTGGSPGFDSWSGHWIPHASAKNPASQNKDRRSHMPQLTPSTARQIKVILKKRCPSSLHPLVFPSSSNLDMAICTHFLGPPCQITINWKVSCCSVTKPYPTFCDPIACSMPGLPVLHLLSEFAQTHVH